MCSSQGPWNSAREIAVLPAWMAWLEAIEATASATAPAAAAMRAGSASRPARVSERIPGAGERGRGATAAHGLLARRGRFHVRREGEQQHVLEVD